MESGFKTWFALLVCAAGVYAQTIVPAKTQITLTAAAGSGPVTQSVSVNSTGGVLLLSTLASSTGNWLGVSPTGVFAPVNLVISGNASQLSAGVYTGTVTVSAPGASTVTITVTFNVSAPVQLASLTVTPPNLEFHGLTAGAQPAAQTLTVGSTGSAISFTGSAITDTGGQWLKLNPSSGTAPTTISVSVNTAGLPGGTYTGTITLTPSSGGSTQIPVTLLLTSPVIVSSSVPSLQFFYQSGAGLPGPQTLTVSVGNAEFAFSTSTSTTDLHTWLSASPAASLTPETLIVTVTPGTLPVGTYTGKVRVTLLDVAGDPLEIPVTLTISNNPLLTVGGTPPAFGYQPGGTIPAPVAIPIGSSSGTLNVAVSTSSSWIIASLSTSQTPASLTIGITPQLLDPGDYTGSVTITAAGAANSPVVIPVRLSVGVSGGSGGTSVLTLTQDSLVLNYQIGGLNQLLAQTIGVSNEGDPLTVTVSTSTSTCGSMWLETFQTKFTTPGTVTIALNTGGLTVPQTCNGTVTLTPAGASGFVIIPVTLNVSMDALFNISPESLSFFAGFEGSPAPVQTINLSTTDNSGAPFTAVAATNSGGRWLTVLPASGTTPGSLSVSADPAILAVGVYTGSITISSTAPSLPNPQVIPVTFTIRSNAAAALSPASLSFTQVAGGAAPASKDVTLSTGSVNASFVATTQTTDSGDWLSAAPNTGTTPATIKVAVNGSALPPGTYQGSVVMTLPAAANSPVTLPVTMTVTSGQTVSASPSSLVFTQVLGDSAPDSQTVTATATPAANVSAAASGATWLSVVPGAAGQFVVSANPVGLVPGSYNGTVTFTAGSAKATANVSLNVLAPAAPAVAAITNAASGERASIAPGEIVTIYGQRLGPPEGAGLQLTDSGKLATNVAGTRVFFDQFEAPILYTSAGQVNTVVPYEVDGRPLVQVVVEHDGVRSEGVTMQTASATPGVFTTAQQGRVQGAVLNQDSVPNGVNAPAARGSVIQVFATGEGVVTPPLQTGSVTSGIHVPLGRVTATVNGLPADVLFAGSAPGAVAGLFQVNLRVPQFELATMPATVAVRISVAGIESQRGVTVVVK